MSTAILSRFKDAGFSPPLVAQVTWLKDSVGKPFGDCWDETDATLLADALNKACREEAGEPVAAPVAYDETYDGKRFVLLSDGTFTVNGAACDWYQRTPTGKPWIPAKRRNFMSLIKQMVRDGQFEPPTTQPKEERR